MSLFTKLFGKKDKTPFAEPAASGGSMSILPTSATKVSDSKIWSDQNVIWC